MLRFLFAIPPRVAFFAAALFIPQFGHAWTSPLPADEPSAEDTAARIKFAADFVADIVFDSNRSGTFGIYTLNPGDGKISALVDGPQHEMYPAASPDGAWIAFAKAVSLDRDAYSEVWRVRADGSDAIRLATHASFPTFSPDGSRIYFERDRREVHVMNADGSAPERLFPNEHHPQFNNRFVVKPVISPDTAWIAFTGDIPNRWNAWMVSRNSGERRKIGAGCEPSWFPDSSTVAWVHRGGAHGGSGIYRYQPTPKESRIPLQDAGAPRGHEYFPTITADGRYLLHSAARNDEHSHNESNYQLMATDIESGATVRLTFDRFNNRWPRKLPRKR
ncbi:MAG: PD40 domain-containing protein [Bdellovibrionales bacterium]|nr:PD40 domain-containing protein [Bdellovibrionales bacterium]